MTCDEFWCLLGNILEDMNIPCKECPVNKYVEEHRDYEPLCGSNCAYAIRALNAQVYKDEVDRKVGIA